MSKKSDDQQRNVTPPGAIDLDAGRRAFFRNVGLGAVGAAVLGSGLGIPSEAQAQAIDDADILNFALNLEYLEAEFYLRAAFGRGLRDEDVSGRGELGAVSGGRRVNFATRQVRNFAEEIARDEENHTQFLRSALGGARVARPRINLGTSFTAAARAAGLIGPGQRFDAYANENNFLLAAFIFEDVGVTAYKGAAPLLRDKGTLEAAAGLLAVEAYHAGLIRTVLYTRGFFKQTFLISAARDSLDGPTDLDQGIGTAQEANIVPADENGLAFSRTPRQVLNIVYLDEGAREGGFFPNGVNGQINR